MFYCLKLTLKDQYACKSCNKVLAEHVTHFKEHLKSCRTYIEKTITKTIQDNNPFHTAKNAMTQQSTINFPRLTNSQKTGIDISAAIWCFMGNHPFNMFESEFCKTFLKALNPAYKPPSRKAISGPLLDSVYTMVKNHMDEVIATLPNINIVTDESSNIRNARICNISVHSAIGSLHYISEDIRAKQMTAAASAQWLRNHLHTLSKGDLSRINSIATDTCNTMFNMWMEIQRFNELRHCLFIPCDSHGIQLLVKDLLQIPSLQSLLQQAQTVVNAFRNAPLQYARLREFQIQYYK